MLVSLEDHTTQRKALLPTPGRVGGGGGWPYQNTLLFKQGHALSFLCYKRISMVPSPLVLLGRYPIRGQRDAIFHRTCFPTRLLEHKLPQYNDCGSKNTEPTVFKEMVFS